MKIEAVLTPAEIALMPENDLSDATCIVFDVLRATSTFVTAFSSGAQEIHPVQSIEEARSLKNRIPGALLGGERHGDRITGFDLGNSPLEYREAAQGRQIISTTTNGTVALRACAAAREVLAGALLNMDALVRHLRELEPERVVLVCAGTGSDLALEDVLAAGCLVDAFSDAQLDDAAQVAHSLYKTHRNDLLTAMESSRNGRALLANGRGEEIRWCARLSAFDVVPRMENLVLRLHTA